MYSRKYPGDSRIPDNYSGTFFTEAERAQEEPREEQMPPHQPKEEYPPRDCPRGGCPSGKPSSPLAGLLHLDRLFGQGVLLNSDLLLIILALLLLSEDGEDDLLPLLLLLLLFVR